ncbi:putative FBD-associated F-box protein [Cardamine amara subsp. amara]|uniref:FBD-associated F-box protein n=1 Tax=Cardamine amara subsp. amara TaxID=228776 RepID=A0ABD1BJW4_CARAN
MEKVSMNDLPDDLLLKILSLLPTFKEIVATSLISKRWRDLWKLLPVIPLLKFDEKSSSSNDTFKSFVYRSFELNNQPIEKLHLKLYLYYSDIKAWIRAAVYRRVRVLRIDFFFSSTLKLPSCLSKCTTLETLQLCGLSINSFPRGFRLPSLKSLHLLSVKFFSNESVERLLSNCPVLENLVVNKEDYDSVRIFNIDVPTLKSLSIENSKGENRGNTNEINGFGIKAPSLMYLNIKDTFSNFIMFEFMPEVIKADIEVIFDLSEKFIGSLPSIQHLSFCSLTSKTPYHRGCFFFYLEHLELCTCSSGWWNLLASMLNDAPRLKSIKLIKKKLSSARDNDQMTRSEEPTVVPKCSLTHLENLEWREYKGTEEEVEVAEYILANATCLKKATFSIRFGDEYRNVFRKLKFMYRVSKTCQLVFD